jgi:hypothetical protein
MERTAAEKRLPLRRARPFSLFAFTLSNLAGNKNLCE